jgi:hypothetical protein
MTLDVILSALFAGAMGGVVMWLIFAWARGR